MSITDGVSLVEKKISSRLRLEFLDGIRALAALYVLMNHASLDCYYRPAVMETHSPFFVFSQYLFGYGHYAVVMFITISGFCLMLPIARSEDGNNPYTFQEYIRRRARRILPPYFASILCSLLLILMVPAMNQKGSGRWDGSLALDSYSIISHLLLIHNWTQYNFAINPPLWSIAVEWQIYFFLPIILYPAWKRGRVWLMVLCAYVLAFAPRFLVGNLIWSRSEIWLIAMFGLGAMGAVFCFSQEAQYKQLLQKIPWGVIAIFLWFVALSLEILKNIYHGDNRGVLLLLRLQNAQVAMDTLAAIGDIAFIIFLTRAVTDQREAPIVLRLLQNRWIVAIGIFSYSLYLIHDPLLAALEILVLRLHVPSLFTGLFMMTFAPVLCIAIAYGFHLVFERPFMSSLPRKVEAKAAS